MLRLLKYLKPYRLHILFAILLLFVQANSDLALPDYMSRIVNVGIQQNGIESAVPEAIRQTQLEKVLALATPDEKELVLANYTLLDQNSAEYATALGIYPALAEEPVYILNPLDETAAAQIDPILKKGLVVVAFIQQAMADPARAAEMGQGLGFDLSKIPAGMDVFAMLENLPAAQASAITSAVEQRLNDLGDTMIKQLAVSAVKTEYAALGMDITPVQTSYILKTGLVMLLLTLLSAACVIGVSYLSSRTAAGLSHDLRQQVFQKVQNFSNAEFDKFSTASLITRSTNDITQIQMVVMMTLRMLFFAPIIGVGGILRAINKSASMWWLIALAVVVLVGLIVSIFSITLPKFKKIQGLIDRLSRVMREQLSGMMVIRAFNKQAFEEARFDQANQELIATNLFVNRVMVLMNPVMMILMNGLTLLIIWVGAQQIAISAMQVGDMLAFMQYAVQILMAFMMMSFMFIMMPRASVSADRIVEVLETKPAILDPQNPVKFPSPFVPSVEFRDVCFRYPDAEEDTLQAINFTARAGETTAFIGTTGSGKSTIVSLIPRFYDVSDGAVLVNGVDVRQVSQHDLREKIGYIPQRSNLFSGTIESNLLYADEKASPEDLQQAVEIAQAAEFVHGNAEGMQAEISQGGTNVSGGQKQRLAIARALVKKAPIYIFDDSFSALDFKTDLALRRALNEHSAGSTLLIVTQRIATIKNAEQIIVLDDGRIVGKGTHAELMKTCEVYRGIALSQLSQEELA